MKFADRGFTADNGSHFVTHDPSYPLVNWPWPTWPTTHGLRVTMCAVVQGITARGWGRSPIQNEYRVIQICTGYSLSTV